MFWLCFFSFSFTLEKAFKTCNLDSSLLTRLLASFSSSSTVCTSTSFCSKRSLTYECNVFTLSRSLSASIGESAFKLFSSSSSCLSLRSYTLLNSLIIVRICTCTLELSVDVELVASFKLSVCDICCCCRCCCIIIYSSFQNSQHTRT